MNGILLIDKPSGWTSFDVVAKVRGTIKSSEVSKPKVGHTGTLDPLATGLLVLVVGSYCKRAQEFSKLDKTYEATMKLGQTSTTGDEEGEKTTISARKPSRAEIDDAVEQFIGTISQIPPAYSAIKINGQRAYKLSRAGKEVEMPLRQVTVNSLKITNYSYPEVKFITDVSSGTYIRTLVQDIGQKLETGAYMSGLRRTIVGRWDIRKVFKMDKISLEVISDNLMELDK